MSWVIATIGLILLGAWLDQILTLRARKRNKQPVKWWKDPDDGPEGDY